MFETVPPASSTINAPAATSQALSPNSQNPSVRPLATLARSSADALRAHHERLPERQVEAAPLAAVIGEAGCEQGRADWGSGAYLDWLAVEFGAAPALRGEAFPMQRVIDDAEAGFTAALIGDRHAELRERVREVGGAVERIDNPSMLAVVSAGAAFLGQDRVGWKRALEHLDHGGFGFAVGLGDQIDRIRFAIDSDARETLQMDFAGRARRAHRDHFDFSSHGVQNIIQRLPGSKSQRIETPRHQEDCVLV